jgi:hypothetical protein
MRTTVKHHAAGTVNWGMATDIKLKDYICTSTKKELKKKGLIILYAIDNIKWQ